MVGEETLANGDFECRDREPSKISETARSVLKMGHGVNKPISQRAGALQGGWRQRLQIK